MGCDWSDVATGLKLESAGAGACPEACAEDSRFCQKHQRRLAEEMVRQAPRKTTSVANKYATHFAMAVTGALGVALVQQWPALLKAIEQSGLSNHPPRVYFPLPSATVVMAALDNYSSPEKLEGRVYLNGFFAEGVTPEDLRAAIIRGGPKR